MAKTKTDQRKRLKHPMQPVGLDDGGVARFKQNAIIRHLYSVAADNGCDMNRIAAMVAQGQFTREDYAQLNQLTGYSVCGYCEISLVPAKSKDAAWAEMEKIGE